MSVEVRPFGVKCNIQCKYCYQNTERDSGNLLHSYDLAEIMKSLEKESKKFSLFGGEPLLMPADDLEIIFKWGYERFGVNSIQTNATLISDEHIQLFKKYNVAVGISIDGPDELNDARWAGSLARTRKATGNIQSAIELLVHENLTPSLIVTLHRQNSNKAALPRMNDWFNYLDDLGIRHVRLHILEIDSEHVEDNFALSTTENYEALLNFYNLSASLKSIKFDLFDEMRNLLLGNDSHSSCVWNACDPYTTRAVQGIEGNGQRSNCTRTNKDGVNFVKANQQSFERYIALYYAPQKFGGCNGCRFFAMCKGQCPGTSIEGDWRYRTRYCEVWKLLFERIESELESEQITPLSRQALRSDVEKFLIANWSQKKSCSLAYALECAQKEANAIN